MRPLAHRHDAPSPDRWRIRSVDLGDRNLTSAQTPGQAFIHRMSGWRWALVGSHEFDPDSCPRVPLAGHSVSTGAAGPRLRSPLGCAHVGGRCRPKSQPAGVSGPPLSSRVHQVPLWSGHRQKKRIGETREQAYLSAEQPSPSQGSRLPSAHAHARRPSDPVGAAPQGPRQPGRLTTAPAAPTLVLPAAHRLLSSDAFRATVRAGRRSGSATLVVHLAVHDPGEPVLVGFVVSKAVGGAVVRNRVKRRLRHLTRDHLPALAGLPGSVVLVLRALPPAATASAAELDADLRRCLARVTSVKSSS